MYSFIGKKFTLPFAWTRTYCEKPIVRISCTFITKPSAVPDPTTRSGQRVLDLGTGLGISGIVAAGLGAEVLLQDRPALRAVGPSRLKWWDYINLSNCFLGNFHVARSPPEFIVNLKKNVLMVCTPHSLQQSWLLVAYYHMYCVRCPVCINLHVWKRAAKLYTFELDVRFGLTTRVISPCNFCLAFSIPSWLIRHVFPMSEKDDRVLAQGDPACLRAVLDPLAAKPWGHRLLIGI